MSFDTELGSLLDAFGIGISPLVEETFVGATARKIVIAPLPACATTALFGPMEFHAEMVDDTDNEGEDGRFVGPDGDV